MVSHQTLSILSARVLIETRVDAVLASASLVLRTLLVAATADHLASDERISFIAWYALAHGSVPGWVALRISSTRILDQTRVDTISIHARLLVSALVVTLAANRHTGNLRITNKARRTDADGAMVFDEAGGSRATVTGVDTLSVDTRLSVGAVVVSSTARRVGQLNWLTFGLGIWHPAFSTGTDHGPEGQTVYNRADGSMVTR